MEHLVSRELEEGRDEVRDHEGVVIRAGKGGEGGGGKGLQEGVDGVEGLAEHGGG